MRSIDLLWFHHVHISPFSITVGELVYNYKHHNTRQLRTKYKGTSQATRAKSSFECARFAHVHIQALACTSPLNPACGFKWPLESS